MTFPQSIGVESEIRDFKEVPDTPGNIIVAFRLIDSPLESEQALSESEQLKVRLVAQVYDYELVERFKRVPEIALAVGQEIHASASKTFDTVELPLPTIPYGRYSIVGKVYSADERYVRKFDPSKCFAYSITYGEFLKISLPELQDIYTGVDNPILEDYIRRRVRQGSVLVVLQDNFLMRATEVNGKLDLCRFE